jgi:hypothetical protein
MRRCGLGPAWETELIGLSWDGVGPLLERIAEHMLPPAVGAGQGDIGQAVATLLRPALNGKDQSPQKARSTSAKRRWQPTTTNGIQRSVSAAQRADWHSGLHRRPRPLEFELYFDA